MADGYNPSASMLQTNPDASLKVFMGGGGAGADGGAGMPYNATATLLQTVPGAELQKFDGGAMMVPTADGQKRLLQDVLKFDKVPLIYENKNNIIRSLDDLRAAFQSDKTYNEFIDWLGSKLINNEEFKTFVKSRMLTISAEPVQVRAKRRSREQIIADELQKSVERIKKTTDELARLEKVRKEADELLVSIQASGETGEKLKQAEEAKRRTEDLIAKQQKQLTTTIATSTAIPTMGDAQLEALAAVPAVPEGEPAKPLAIALKPEPTAPPKPTPEPTAPLEADVIAAEAAKKGAEEAVAAVVPPPEIPTVNPSGATATVVPPPEIPAGTKGGNRKAPRRTLRRRSNKARKTSLKNYK